MMVRRDRLIRAMDDSELEDFCRRWVSGRSGCFEVKRFGQAGDMGRDVVGFCAPQRHEGNWDNYQCKQYRGKVGTAEGILAVGKIFYWASQGHFTVPRTFYFVAPNGRSEEHTSELQSLMRISYAVFCLKKKKNIYYMKASKA